MDLRTMYRELRTMRNKENPRVLKMDSDQTDFGPIYKLLIDEDVSEVMVNGPNQVYCERNGKLMLTPIHFRDNKHVLKVIEKIAAKSGQIINESSPMVDARLPDGSRFNAIIPPLAHNGPTITIRKYSKDLIQVKDLITSGTLTFEMVNFLEACVKARLNMFVSGSSGSGKTTVLNILSNFIPKSERIVTIEETSEIQLQHEHVTPIKSRQQTDSGNQAVSVPEILKKSSRIRPDRVIIGEVRSVDDLNLLKAIKSGQVGLLATGHLNCPMDLITRLETIGLLAEEDFPHKQFAETIDVIIHLSRFKDGSRKIVSITEVQMKEDGTIGLEDIFTFKQEGINSEGKIIGRLVPTGIRPKFFDRLKF
jgi:pilus assembly protein CpaF